MSLKADSWNPAILSEALLTGEAGGGGSELPSVSGSDNGKVLGVVNGSWDKMELNSGSYNISADEAKTNKKYYGSDVYTRVIEMGSGSITAGTNANFMEKPSYVNKLISFKIILEGTDVQYSLFCNSWIDGGRIYILSPLSASGDFYVVLEYTKTT